MLSMIFLRKMHLPLIGWRLLRGRTQNNSCVSQLGKTEGFSNALNDFSAKNAFAADRLALTERADAKQKLPMAVIVLLLYQI
jgi:hypothetical protein